MGRRFNDQSYIDDYLVHGKFPKIHDHVASLIQQYASESEVSMDLGSNIGMLALRSVELGRSFCIGIEGGLDFGRAVPHKNVKYENFFIKPDTFPRLKDILKEYKPTLVTARRVISEIGIGDVEVVREMGKLFHENGVKKFILQGRVPVKNPTVKLHNSDLEAEALFPYFEIKKTNNAAYYLEST